MFQTEQHALLKNRRSSSMICEQLSKRSSISTSNINVLNVTDCESFANVQSSNSNQKSNLSHQKLLDGIVGEKQQVMIEQLIQRGKKQIIQPYRIVKKHVKENLLQFNQLQLKEVYQGMSNTLKSLQKALAKTSQLMKQNNLAANLNLYKLPQQQRNSVKQSNNSMITNSFINCSIVGNDPNPCTSQLLCKIQELQEKIQFIRQEQNQQIHLMISNHEQEMMFVESQHEKKIKQVRFQTQSHVDSLIKQQRKKGQEYRKKELQQKRKEQESKMQMNRLNQLISVKIQSARQLQIVKLEQLRKQFILKQECYVSAVKSLLGKLKQSRDMCEVLTINCEENIQKSRLLVSRLIDSLTKLSSNPTKNKSTFLNLLSSKLQFLNNLPRPSIMAVPQPNLYSTVTIQQMFMRSDESILAENNYQISLEKSLEQLVMLGFFNEENQQTVGMLFAVGKEVGVREESEQGQQGLGMLGHSLYPLIVQKIKLTLSKHQTQQQQLLAPVISNNISEFDTQSLLKRHLPQVQYRNIQSIQQLQVGDSMIMDEDQFQKNNIDDEIIQLEREVKQEEDNLEERRISYGGYQSNPDDSDSFDADIY